MSRYDYLIVGSGLFGAVFAHEAKKKGKKCLIIDKRNHQGGNVYCEQIEEINVHKYGAHIFHTNDKEIWEYVNQFVEFNRYTNSPVAFYKDEVYNLPFNMNTFQQLWGVKTPKEAKNTIYFNLRTLAFDSQHRGTLAHEFKHLLQERVTGDAYNPPGLNKLSPTVRRSLYTVSGMSHLAIRDVLE